jgi:uncharacterized protein (TIGR02996 family)
VASVLLPSEHELLLRIIEAPDDDQLRFVLADLLNARGEPMGELITVQCALESIRAQEGRGDYRALKARERELLELHRPRWHQQAAPFARELEFRRGLPEVLHASAGALLQDGGLTVLAPIRELELTQVMGTSADRLLQLPLLQRIRRLAVQGLDSAALFPLEPLPRTVKHLKLEVRQHGAFDAAARAGWFNRLDCLELNLRWLEPVVLSLLEPTALKRLWLYAGHDQGEDIWLRVVERMLELNPALEVRWRGESCDVSNLRSVLPLRAVRLLDRADLSLELKPELPTGEPVARQGPSELRLERLLHGGLVARSEAPSFTQEMQLHGSLPQHASYLVPQAYAPGALLYPPWPARSLLEAGLPLAPKRAVGVMSGVALAIEALSRAFVERGVHSWPTSLSLDDVWLGDDGAVKVLPPFLSLSSGVVEPEVRWLGLPVESPLWGTVPGWLFLCGTGLLHLLCGEPPVHRPASRLWTPSQVLDHAQDLRALREHPLLPSMLNAEWKRYDPLVERCLTVTRSRQFATLADFAAECLAQSAP